MLDKPLYPQYTNKMILKDGESLVHLRLRIEKEMSELNEEQAKEYRNEVIKDIFNAAMQEKIDVPSARSLIESIDPDFYTKPNELRSSVMRKLPFKIIQALFLSVFAIGLIVLMIGILFA